jgi:hypothetical protein
VPLTVLDPRLDVRTVVYGERERPPYALFVRQDGDQRERFLLGADHQLSGHHWHAPRTAALVGT